MGTTIGGSACARRENSEARRIKAKPASDAVRPGRNEWVKYLLVVRVSRAFFDKLRDNALSYAISGEKA